MAKKHRRSFGIRFRKWGSANSKSIGTDSPHTILTQAGAKSAQRTGLDDEGLAQKAAGEVTQLKAELAKAVPGSAAAELQNKINTAEQFEQGYAAAATKENAIISAYDKAHPNKQVLRVPTDPQMANTLSAAAQNSFNEAVAYDNLAQKYREEAAQAKGHKPQSEVNALLTDAAREEAAGAHELKAGSAENHMETIYNNTHHAHEPLGTLPTSGSSSGGSTHTGNGTGTGTGVAAGSVGAGPVWSQALNNDYVAAIRKRYPDAEVSATGNLQGGPVGLSINGPLPPNAQANDVYDQGKIVGHANPDGTITWNQNAAPPAKGSGAGPGSVGNGTPWTPQVSAQVANEVKRKYGDVPVSVDGYQQGGPLTVAINGPIPANAVPGDVYDNGQVVGKINAEGKITWNASAGTLDGPTKSTYTIDPVAPPPHSPAKNGEGGQIGLNTQAPEAGAMAVPPPPHTGPTPPSHH